LVADFQQSAITGFFIAFKVYRFLAVILQYNSILFHITERNNGMIFPWQLLWPFQ